MKDIRIAAAIFNARAGEMARNLSRMAPWIRQARDQGAQLLCFPELSLSGYDISPELGKYGEPVPGEISRQLADRAAEEGVCVLAGLAEQQQGKLFASHLVALPDGAVSVYRKLHISPPEKGVFSAGDGIPIFELNGVKFGIQLCYDAHFPELSSAMAAKGAEVLFFPHASPRGTPEGKYRSWMRHLPARAFDNSLFVVACNPVGPNGKGLAFPGLALAFDPSGYVEKHKLGNQEGLLVADLKADKLHAVRSHRMRYFFPHRRPALYHENINVTR